jgi:hypothetical protein
MFGDYNPDMQRNSRQPVIDDRRDAPRTEVDGRYSMSVDPCDGRNPIECALIDFSVTGVRLELPEDTVLPEKVLVLIGGLSHNCRIVWRKGTTVGVDFIDEHHSIF